MNRTDIVEKFLSRDFLVSPDLLERYDGGEELFKAFLERDGPLVVNGDVFSILKKTGKLSEINWSEFDKSRAIFEKGRDGKVYKTFLDILSYHSFPETKRVLDKIEREIRVPEKTVVVEKLKGNAGVIVTKSYVDEGDKKKEVSNFVQYFRMRYSALRDILSTRQELQGAISINRLASKKDREEVALIGMVKEKRKTKNDNYLIELEDMTGVVTMLINKTKEELFDLAGDLVLDETIGVLGVASDNFVYVNSIICPDVPLVNEVKKCPEDVCVAFISDIHVGSTNFLEKEFLSFIEWLNKKEGAAGKIKYVFVTGDLVEGVGVFPDQEKSLLIGDIKNQYSELARYLGMIRKDLQIIICPGDHDALRLSHPQPILSKKLAGDVHALDNVVLVTNPSMVNVHSSPDFPGFDVLMYHGHGFHYYTDNVESLRKNSAVDNPRNIMKFLLQRRHLAPTHTSTIYVPDSKEDPLVIDKVPDVFVAGHLHKSDVGSYRNVITINSSCWQSRTDFQVKVGNHPDPCKVPVLNLKTREVEIVSFEK